MATETEAHGFRKASAGSGVGTFVGADGPWPVPVADAGDLRRLALHGEAVTGLRDGMAIAILGLDGDAFSMRSPGLGGWRLLLEAATTDAACLAAEWDGFCRGALCASRLSADRAPVDAGDP